MGRRNDDGDRILQTLRNLLGNAAKFTQEKGRITVTGHRVNGGVEVAVEDTGPGIPEEKLATVFEKFSGSDPKRGTGLGLTICYNVVKQLQGDIMVSSEEGVGTTFTVTLPAFSPAKR